MVDSKLDRIRTSEPHSEAILAGGLGALLGLALLILSAGVASDVRLQYTTSDPIPVVPFFLYAGIGVLSVGGAVGYLYRRYRTVTPPLISAILFT